MPCSAACVSEGVGYCMEETRPQEFGHGSIPTGVSLSHALRPLVAVVSLFAIMSISVACGGSGAAPAASMSDSPASSSAAELVPEANTSGAAAASSAGTSSLHVDLTEWSIKPDVTSIKAGTVQITATNKGTMEHELVLLKTTTPANALPMSADGSTANEDASGASAGELDAIPAGQSKSNTFTLTAGHYVLICNEPGHYKQGMAIDFTVN